jgi:hypothetical protein
MEIYKRYMIKLAQNGGADIVESGPQHLLGTVAGVMGPGIPMPGLKINLSDFYAIAPRGGGAQREADGMLELGTILVRKKNGPVGTASYIGSGPDGEKKQFPLINRVQGVGGIRGTATLTDAEVENLLAMVPNSHREAWEHFFSENRDAVEADSVQRDESGFNPASWFRKSRETQRRESDAARHKLQRQQSEQERRQNPPGARQRPGRQGPSAKLMLEELTKLANHLDKRGLTKEADYLDALIKKAQDKKD